MMKSTNYLFNVVITGPPIAKEGIKLLSRTCRIENTKPYLEPSELALELRGKKADGLLVRMGKITREVIEASPKLKVIAKHRTGIDNIELGAATELKIPVLIATLANYESVAEHVLGLMFSLAKDIPRLDARIREGYWDKPNYRGVELFNKTLGLIGFGRIGRRVKELVAPLQMKVLVYDPILESSEIPGDVIRVEKLEELLKSSDIVSLHCPLTDQTRHLISKNELRAMKKTAWLINTARGEVVDEEALIESLEKGEITAAGIDTFNKEPPEDINRICNAGKIILSPHIAGITEESFKKMVIDTAKNIITILEGKEPDRRCVVNPEVFEN
ncbi:hydroxyacid dehydrogenase [bacterium]|nr:hydroxyacid dehydrogenase [bacterium]